jgi:hypothetical protein
MSAGLGMLLGYQLTAPSTLNRPVTKLSQEVTDEAKNTVKQVTLAPSMPTTSVVAVMNNPIVASQQPVTTTLSVSSPTIVFATPERLPIGSPSVAQQGLQRLNPSGFNSPPSKTQEQTPKAGVYEMAESRSTARLGSTLGNRNAPNVVAIDAQKSEPVNSLKVIGVPVDGILNIDVAGAVRSYKIGDRLPDGKVLNEANAERNTFKAN